MAQRQYNFKHTVYRSWNSSVSVETGLQNGYLKWYDYVVSRCRNLQLSEYMSQTSCNVVGTVAVPLDLQLLRSEAVHLPPNHTEIMNKWSSESFVPYAFMIYKHIISKFTYCLQLLRRTFVSTWVCVCVYIWSRHLSLLYSHRAAHIQHIVICNSFSVDITAVWCLFVELVIPVC